MNAGNADLNLRLPAFIGGKFLFESQAEPATQ